MGVGLAAYMAGAINLRVDTASPAFGDQGVREGSVAVYAHFFLKCPRTAQPP